MRQFEFNLQLFGEKTEKATGKKRSDARKKGQVVFSKDFNMAITFMATMILLNSFGGFIITRLKQDYLYFSNYSGTMDDMYTPTNISIILGKMVTDIMSITAPILFGAMVIGVMLNYFQIGILFTTDPIKMKLDKLNPINGLKQMFSIRSIVELAKNLVKIMILSYVAYAYLQDKMALIVEMMKMDAIQIGLNIWNLLYNLSIRISLILIIIGVVDFIYKKWQNERDLRMSKEEVKEEYKMLEGNPQVKAKIREKQRMMAMSRMMQEVPKADVIITNPTHFAVAVKYDMTKFAAPYVLAKGQDLIAKNIRKVAEENKIPIVENKPLARELYASVEIGRTIPENLYHAVAEILAFVYKVKK